MALEYDDGVLMADEVRALRAELAAARVEFRAAHDEVVRHLATHSHHLRGDIRAIAERLAALASKIDRRL